MISPQDTSVIFGYFQYIDGGRPRIGGLCFFWNLCCVIGFIVWTMCEPDELLSSIAC